MSYPCTKCGLCCQNIGKIKMLENLDRGDGTCVNFNPIKGCNIYEKRPLACQIDAGYEAFASSLMSKAEYYQKNVSVCNEIQREANFPRKFRVVLSP